MSVPKQMSRLSRGLYVRGAVVESSGEHWTVFDPATEESLGEVADATDAEVDDALAAANGAWKGWWALSALERAERLHRVAQTLRGMRTELAEMITREMGKPYKESADEVDWSITALDYYAEIGRHDTGHVLGPAVAGQMHFTLKEPMGVVVDHPPVQLPVRAALLGGGGRACRRQRGDGQALGAHQPQHAAVHGGFRGARPGAGPVRDRTAAASVSRLVGVAQTHMVAFTGSVPDRTGGRPHLRRNLQAVPDRGFR